jgi:hypothetical protein
LLFQFLTVPQRINIVIVQLIAALPELKQILVAPSAELICEIDHVGIMPVTRGRAKGHETWKGTAATSWKIREKLSNHFTRQDRRIGAQVDNCEAGNRILHNARFVLRLVGAREDNSILFDHYIDQITRANSELAPNRRWNDNLPVGGYASPHDKDDFISDHRIRRRGMSAIRSAR